MTAVRHLPPYRIPGPRARLRGDADLPDLPKEGCIQDFWRWTLSDLILDYSKGWFAEWMVGILAGLPMAQTTRLDFLPYDFDLRDKLRLEVKAKSRLNAPAVFHLDGSLRDPPKLRLDDRVSFGNLRTRTGAYNADLYAFCFHKEEDLKRWDPLDLSQWEFYVLRQNELNGAMSITLARLRTPYGPMTARQFQKRLRDEIANGETSPVLT